MIILERKDIEIVWDNLTHQMGVYAEDRMENQVHTQVWVRVRDLVWRQILNQIYDNLRENRY